MLTLSGQLFAIQESDFTDKVTGVITKKYKAEILDSVGGKTSIESLSVEPLVSMQWRKAVGSHVSIQVRMFALAGNRPGSPPIFGLSLLDKNSIPVVEQKPVLKAA